MNLATSHRNACLLIWFKKMYVQVYSEKLINFCHLRRQCSEFLLWVLQIVTHCQMVAVLSCFKLYTPQVNISTSWSLFEGESSNNQSKHVFLARSIPFSPPPPPVNSYAGHNMILFSYLITTLHHFNARMQKIPFSFCISNFSFLLTIQYKSNRICNVSR
jgi:hypothetical protein